MPECFDTRKRQLLVVLQFLGDKLVSWMSKKQDCTAMSLANAEYVALSASCAQVLWMKTQLKDYGLNYNKIPLYCDSQSAIAIHATWQHSRTSTIHTRFHFNQGQGDNEKQHQPEDIQELLRKLLNDVQIISEELADYINTLNWNRPAFYKDDDEEYTIAITPVLSTEEPDNSLSMGNEHLSTISETKLDGLIKSIVENLVPILSESESFSDIKSECDVPVCDDFTTFSNPLFDADDDFSSSDDESFSDEDVPKEIYSNPLFDEEIISTKIDPHHFNAESDLIESLLNRDTLIISSPKFDSLLEEFSGELAHIDLIPPGINETDFDPEEEIRLVEKLLYDNSSPRPPEEFNSENSDAIIESFSPSPIPVEDSDSLMEEIDLFLTPDDSMPPGIENDDYDSEGDILFLEELLSNDSPSLPENESFHFDVPSSPRPPALKGCWLIMPPKIRTRSAGRPVAESRGGGTGQRVGRGPRGGNDERVDELNGQGNDQGMGANGGHRKSQWKSQVGNQRNVGNQNGNVVNENVQENIRNVLVNGNRIEKMESVQDMSSCSIDQKVKYTAGSFVGKALARWNSQFRTLSREVAVSMSWNDFKFMMIC
ncbi:hypothetical protein Tco_0039874 [Tanacetum coccineum]